jgi:membrane-anchored glycerophosphoryl diester phosphodiesterase (GDPDase)
MRVFVEAEVDWQRFGAEPVSLALGYLALGALIVAALYLPGPSLLLIAGAALLEARLVAARHGRFIHPAKGVFSTSVNMLICLLITRLLHAFLWLAGLFALIMITAALTAQAGVNAGETAMTPQAFTAALGTGGQGLVLLILFVVCAFMFYADKRLMLAQPLTMRDGQPRVMLSFAFTRNSWRVLGGRRELARLAGVILIGLALTWPAVASGSTALHPLLLGACLSVSGWLGAVFGIPERAGLLLKAGH